MSREDLELILLQGVGFVTMPDGCIRIFNVHLHNRIPYDKKLKNSYKQARYWYFKEASQSVAQELAAKYDQRKEVVLAGDVYNIGIGKLVLLRYQNLKTRKQEARLGIIADTGAAFHNNLYQLDAFTGMIAGNQQLHHQVNHMLDTVNAYIIYKKE